MQAHVLLLARRRDDERAARAIGDGRSRARDERAGGRDVGAGGEHGDARRVMTTDAIGRRTSACRSVCAYSANGTYNRAVGRTRADATRARRAHRRATRARSRPPIMAADAPTRRSRFTPRRATRGRARCTTASAGTRTTRRSTRSATSTSATSRAGSRGSSASMKTTGSRRRCGVARATRGEEAERDASARDD